MTERPLLAAPLMVCAIGLLIAMNTHAPSAEASSISRKSPAFEMEATSTVNSLNAKASPPKGHHFNVQAPMRAVFDAGKPIRPAKASEASIEFEIPAEQLPKKAAEGTVSLYLCDDAKSYCERHDLPIHWQPKKK